MNNVSLIESYDNGKKIWKLINNNGDEFKSFNIFSKLLLKRYKENTRFSYSRSVALFIDYIEEVNITYSDTPITKSFLIAVIESFFDWLVYGGNSGNELAKKINETYQSKEYNSKSANLVMSGVKLFLKASEKIRLEQEDNDIDVAESLFPELYIREALSINAKNKMVKTSMFGGVISNGPQLIKSCILPKISHSNYFDEVRAFPFDKIVPLIDSFSSYRDKALYMLCAASGCRIHEALQILIEDIDLKERTVNLIDPNTRITNKSYKALTPENRNKLNWKGRQTYKTFLIQPFGDLFFEYLEEYIKNEYLNHERHEFIFQHIRGNDKGKPFFLSAASTRNEAFKKATDKINLTTTLNQGVHSLRHMYGTYLLNYLPKADGSYGLPVAIVQKIMGHATLTATQKYARYDKDLISIELEYANNLICHNDNLSLLEMKKRALISQIEDLEKQYNAIKLN
jgi:integrase